MTIVLCYICTLYCSDYSLLLYIIALYNVIVYSHGSDARERELPFVSYDKY